MTEVNELLNELSSTEGVLGCGIVSRDGRPIDLRLSSGLSSETISIMCATVYGAAITLQSEAMKEMPQNVVISTGDNTTRIYGCGSRALVLAILAPQYDDARVKDIVGALNREFSS